jgi:hypothetical protein
MLRESIDGADFARRLNEMLSFNSLTETVFKVLRNDDYREWMTIATEIKSADSASRVHYQCRRALEEAPDHAGLHLLSALALQGSEEHRRDEVVAALGLGMMKVREGFYRDDQRNIANWIVMELARIAPTAAPGVLNQIVRQDLDPALATAVLRGVDAGTIAADPILVRTSQRCLLHRIDDRLNHFMNG